MLIRTHQKQFQGLCYAALTLVAMLLLASCVTTQASRSEAQVEAEIYRLVNEERQAAGLASLARDPTLDALARQYASSGFAPTIDPPSDIRYLLYNSWRITYDNRAPRLRENAARDQVDYCLANPDLREAMLRSNARKTGVGVGIVGNTVYYTQVFDVINAAAGNGEPLALHDNPAAQDPSWSDLLRFVLEDDTDQQPYLEDSFVCTDFAAMLHDRAEAAGIRAAYVSVDLAVGPGHALSAFNTTDRGLVYIDCTGQGLSFAAPGGATGNSGPIDYDKVAYLSVGSELGLISIDRASSFDYAFYEEWLSQWEDYDSKVTAYNRKQDAYSAAVGGRTVIADPDEHAALEEMYRKLEGLKLELEAVEDALGSHSWKSPGTVTGFYVHW